MWRFPSFEAIARRKLRQLAIAGQLEGLRIPPGTGPAAVEIVDYP